MLEIGNTVNGAVDGLLKAPLVHSTAKNPIYTAIMITLIVALIVLVVFREADTNESLLLMTFRVGFWTLFATLGVVLVHNKVLLDETEASAKAGAYEGAFETCTSVFEDAIVPVRVNFTE